MDISLAELAARLGGVLIGDGAVRVTGAGGLDNAGAGDMVYIKDESLLPAAEKTAAAALLVPFGISSAVKPVIQVSGDMRTVFGQVLAIFDWRKALVPGVHPSAVVDPTAVIDPSASIGALATIGANTVIGANTMVGAQVSIGNDVTIGADCLIYAHVTIYDYCTIGDRVALHSGVVIAGDGFGYNPTQAGWEKVAHLGTVVIEDDVEIGANSTVDRATTGATVIGRGTKIDNLVQVAHNCQLGENCLIIAQVGLGGSTELGDWVILAGQVGVGDHRKIGSGARIAGQAGDACAGAYLA
ncbi:MAG: UDP-3-O-(3-hydroxymyristoyl)glucosamine N-acyltransferase, partial [bacterium]